MSDKLPTPFEFARKYGWNEDIEAYQDYRALWQRMEAARLLIDEASAPRANCEACDDYTGKHPHFSMKVWVQKARAALAEWEKTK